LWAGRIAPQTPYTWDSVGARDWIDPADTIAAKHGAVMLFDKVTVDDATKKGLTVLVTIYRRVRIVSALGHSSADVSVPFYYGEQKVKSIVGRSIRRNGDTTALQPDQIIVKEAFRSKDAKIKTTSFSIPGVSDDCIIEYCIKLELPYAFQTWLIQRDIPLLYGRLDWILSTEGSKSSIDLGYWAIRLVPNWVALNLSRKVKAEKLPSIKDTKEIVFTVDSVPALEKEEYSLPEKAISGQLRIYYGSTDSPSAYWADYAQWVPKWADAYLAKTSEIKKTAALFADVPAERKVDSAYAWVKSRFVNLSYLKSEDSAKLKIKSETAKDAFKTGYASRRQINYIFYDLLRELNIDAKLVWVEDRDEDLFVPEVKSWQFDRNLIAVPDTETTWFFYSPGDRFLPPGSVAWYNEGVSGLIGGWEQSSQVVIPFSKSTRNKLNRSINLSLTEDLEASAQVTELRTGHRARRYRVRIADAAESEKTDVIRDELKDNYTEVEIDSIHFENVDSTAMPLKLTYAITYPSVGAGVAGDQLLLKPLSFLQKATNPFASNQRQNAIVLDYAHEINEALTITIPAGWSLTGLPPDTLVSSDYGLCAVRFARNDSAIMVQRSLAVKIPFLQATDYAVAQELFGAYASLATLTLTLQRKPE
jgi:hypothetical protein